MARGSHQRAAGEGDGDHGKGQETGELDGEGDSDEEGKARECRTVARSPMSQMLAMSSRNTRVMATLFLIRTEWARKLGSEAKRGGGNDGGEGAGEPPRPPGDHRAEDHGQQQHPGAAVANQCIGVVVADRVVQRVNRVNQRWHWNGIQHRARLIRFPIHFQGVFGCDGGDVEFPQRRVFRIAAEIVVMGLNPGADEV